MKNDQFDNINIQKILSVVSNMSSGILNIQVKVKKIDPKILYKIVFSTLSTLLCQIHLDWRV